LRERGGQISRKKKNKKNNGGEKREAKCQGQREQSVKMAKEVRVIIHERMAKEVGEEQRDSLKKGYKKD